MKNVVKKNNCLVATEEKHTKIIDDARWNEIDKNAIADLHLALADEHLALLIHQLLIYRLC